jgi:hypothetical protein
MLQVPVAEEQSFTKFNPPSKTLVKKKALADFDPLNNPPPAPPPVPEMAKNIPSSLLQRGATAAETEAGIKSARSDWVLGIILVSIGAVAILYSLAMNVGVSSGYGERIANADLMNQRLGYAIIGVGLFVAGTVLYGLSSLRRALWQSHGG